MGVLRKIFLGLLLLMALTGGVVAAAWLSMNQDKEQETAQEQQEPAEVEEPVIIRTELNGNEFSYGDTLTVSTTIENISETSQEITFSDSCTDPTVSFDGQVVGEAEVCAQVITDIELPAGETREYEAEFELVESLPETTAESDSIERDGQLALEPGGHEVQVAWSDLSSETIEFSVSD